MKSLHLLTQSLKPICHKPMSKLTVAAFYQFVPLANYQELKPRLEALCTEQGIKGIVLLASEGVNGTVAGSREAIDVFKSLLTSLFDRLEYKESFAEKMPFSRLRVRLKKEIVTLGVDVNPAAITGQHVEPQEWNQLISDPDVLVIDVRNDYEVEIGTFTNAQNPLTESFTKFPDYVKTIDRSKTKKVAMCCTGGIRCEKASAYMLSQGFDEVYQLKGGILKYLETVPPEQSLWRGECFVFDQRVAVSHGLQLGDYQLCYGCRRPILEEEKNSPLYERGVCCSACHDVITPEKREGARERQRQEDLARSRGQVHVGASHPQIDRHPRIE